MWLLALCSFNRALLSERSRARKHYHLSVRTWRYEGDNEYERETSVVIPTETMEVLPEPEIMPSKPKIVVLGATGKIGRLVVRQLLETTSLGEATIVAFVRDYDKACRVLYDGILVTNQKKKKKPTLQIVEANLVPPEELPGYRDLEEEDWLRRASSAATFYGNSVQDYEDRYEKPSHNEALEEAIRGCTAIISCVGSVRPTHFWSDFLARPFLRILRKDVSSWCQDPRHPYYVNYLSTRKALALAEKEQLRRQSLKMLTDPTSKEKKLIFSRDKNIDRIPSRIRFVRISDLCLSQQPWHFVPLLTNIMHSMVFRYQDMTEQLLQSSSLIDTIILRPGDLSDEERNVTTTALQVDPSGSLPSPSRVGREDVASLALSSALLPMLKENVTRVDDNVRPQAVHYTLAVRWVGENLHPYPAQGTFKDGFASAQACLRHVFRNTNPTTTKLLRNKPYAVCTAIPVYAVLFLLLRSVKQSILPLAFSYLPGRFYISLFLSRICEVAALLFGILAGPLGFLTHLPSWSLRFGKTAPKFISF